jgi:hypothetical protein
MTGRLASVAIVAVAAGLGLVGFYVWRKGGIAGAAAGAGAAAVEAVGGAASGAVGAIGAAVGLPTPAQTTTDPRVARWIIDSYGYMTASQWSGLPALVSAMGLASGSGTPPPAGSALAAALPVLPVATYDETDRLLNRYPAPDPSADQDLFGLWGVGRYF